MLKKPTKKWQYGVFVMVQYGSLCVLILKSSLYSFIVIA